VKTASTGSFLCRATPLFPSLNASALSTCGTHTVPCFLSERGLCRCGALERLATLPRCRADGEAEHNSDEFWSPSQF
jgi:hypothetical protein